MLVQSDWCYTLTQQSTTVPLVPMTPRTTCSLQSYRTGALTCHQARYLEQRRGSMLQTELACRDCARRLFSSFLFPLTQANCFFHPHRDTLTPENVSQRICWFSHPSAIEECRLKGVVLLFPPHVLDLVIKWPQDELDQLIDPMGNKLFERICDLFSARSANWPNLLWAAILVPRQEKLMLRDGAKGTHPWEVAPSRECAT